MNTNLASFFEENDEELVDTQICKTCSVNKPIYEFYLESSSKSKYYGQLRKQCIDCWRDLKGKMIKPSLDGSKLFYCETI